jgi:hypothetical protein
LETRSGDTGLARDKHLKLYKPNSLNFVSTTPNPIKVTTTAHMDPHTKRSRVNKISKILTETGKVTAVVAVMTVFKNYKISSALICKN